MWVPDSFFTALLSGRISSLRDEMGAIFIDRDPKLFATILNYLRTRDIDLSVDIRAFRHEAEYYGIAPLVKRLMLCEDLCQSSCGDVLFYGYLPPPCTCIYFVSTFTFKKYVDLLWFCCSVEIITLSGICYQADLCN